MPNRVALTEDEYRQHCDDLDGYCFSCAEWTEGGVEPDARRYTCGECKKPMVYGAEELSIMDAIEFID